MRTQLQFERSGYEFRLTGLINYGYVYRLARLHRPCSTNATHAANGCIPTWVLVDDFTRSINAANAVNAANAADVIPSPPAQKLDDLPQFDLWGGLL